MEKERLKFCIERFDHYYDSINNKSAVFLGLSTFVVGGLVAAYPSVLSLANCSLFVHLNMLSVIGLGIATMIIVIIASTPFLSRSTESMLYFGSISCMTKEQYHVKSGTVCSEEDELIDLRTQVHQLSCGLAYKFKQLKLAGALITIQFCLFIPLILLIVCNLK